MHGKARVHLHEVRLERCAPIQLGMPDEGGAPVTDGQGARSPVRERTQGLQPMGSAIRETSAEIATEKITADAGEQKPGRKARNGVVGPSEKADLSGREKGPASKQTSDEPSVRDETAVSQREKVAHGSKLVGVGQDRKS